jgi:HEAT repeat protein
MKLIALSLVAALTAGTAVVTQSHAADPRLPAASWAPADTGDSLWRRGRIAISDESWDRAAESFREIVDRYPRSAYAGDALYWEAFALQRLGRQSDLRRAVAALERQKDDYGNAQTLKSGDSGALLTRLKGRLARGGDAAAAVDVAELADEIASVSVAATARALAEAEPAMRAALAAVEPAMRAGLAEARAELAHLRGGFEGEQGDIPPGCEGAIDDERIEALNALMQMNGDQALPILKRVLQRRDKCSEILRRKAVFLVSQQEGDAAADILVEVAKTDPDRRTREDAVFWLSQTGSERAAEVLEAILLDKSADREMQKKALFSLAQSETPRSGRALREFVRREDVDPEVRAEAIFWLGESGDGEHSAFLRELFPTVRAAEVQEKIIFSLSQHPSPENSRFLLARAKDRSLSNEMRKSALFWAGQGGVPVKDLAEVYDSAGDDRELREQVIFTLSQRRGDDPITKLIDIARKEPDRELRKQAVFWLSQSQDPRAAKFLEELINR